MLQIGESLSARQQANDSAVTGDERHARPKSRSSEIQQVLSPRASPTGFYQDGLAKPPLVLLLSSARHLSRLNDQLGACLAEAARACSPPSAPMGISRRRCCACGIGTVTSSTPLLNSARTCSVSISSGSGITR